jgi:predicted NAD/FAD-binding protein
MRQNIAIVGSGISGLTTAWLLKDHHDVTLFEAGDSLGGHTNTEIVELNGQHYPVNTGFIVYNDWTYPNFERLLKQLGTLRSEKTEMSFSVGCAKTGLEYCGSSISALFAQKRNWLNPKFHQMLRTIIRFNQESLQRLDANSIPADQTLADYLQIHHYKGWFVEKYIVPMGAAIWSTGQQAMLTASALFFLKFFRNHGLLSVRHRPQWYTLSGGSEAYIEPITQGFKDRIHLNTAVRNIQRHAEHVVLQTDLDQYTFDQVVLACHSDQALSLLAAPTPAEQAVLGDMPYTPNDVILHTDASILPKRRKAWAAWNYHIGETDHDGVAVTYNMNILQNFHTAPETFCVSLNYQGKIDPSKIIKQFSYSHPLFSARSQAAQSRFHEISHQSRTHYCGAYWFNGFHEDGVNSALRVAADFGIGWPESS